MEEQLHAEQSTQQKEMGPSPRRPQESLSLKQQGLGARAGGEGLQGDSCASSLNTELLAVVRWAQLPWQRGSEMVGCQNYHHGKSEGSTQQ